MLLLSDFVRNDPRPHVGKLRTNEDAYLALTMDTPCLFAVCQYVTNSRNSSDVVMHVVALNDDKAFGTSAG